jgi:hypothetical protein
MVIPPRQPLFLRICSLALLFVLIGLQVPSPVRADVGPQPILPGGSSIQPGEQTPIQMAVEVVTMNVRQATEADNALVKLNPKWYRYNLSPVWFQAIADVEADFTMKNPTGESVSMTVWFPLASALENVGWSLRPSETVPRITSFQVSVDGNPLDYAVSELPNPKGEDKPLLPWASFPVTFPAGEETAIHVCYSVPLQPSTTGSEMALYYIFQTGAGWAGPIGQAELILNLPYPASAGTLAFPSHLSLPPMYVPNPAELPPGVVLKGNQARWTRKNFEPGPEDDFAAWLLRLDRWQELETARAAVKVNPRDGQSWLNLASLYLSMSITTNINNPKVFSPSYIPLGIEAYRKAVDLLPEHPAPHVGLALLTLASYWKDDRVSLKVIQFAQDEYQIAKELDAKNPSLAVEDGISGEMIYLLEDAINAYYYNDATATVDAATRAVERAAYDATRTAEATLNYATITVWAIDRATSMALFETDMACWAAAGAGCTATPSPTATLTPNPTLAATPVLPTIPPPVTPTPIAEMKGQSQDIIVAAGVLGLVVVIYLASKRLRKIGEKQE